MYASAAGTFVVTERINTAWRRLGQHPGTLGFPASDELPCHQGGRYQRFGNGMIVWHPSTGAYAVQGLILAKYTALGGSVGAAQARGVDRLVATPGVAALRRARA
jgi:uncharacterized protein with LGFP repeats